jgi:hypothetical protein
MAVRQDPLLARRLHVLPAAPEAIAGAACAERVDESTIERSIPEHYAQPDPSDHPLTRHCFYERRDRSPIRMSDVISDRQLRSIRIYCDVFRPAVTHQVALVYRRPPAEHLGHTSMWQRRGFTDAEPKLTRRAAPVENASYTLMRQGGDFTETEPDLAIGLQVLLYALCQVIGTSRCAHSETTERLRLTRAKGKVPNLLACGLAAVASFTRDGQPRTAQAPGERLRQAWPADRLQAADYARQTGLIPRSL